MNFAYVYSLCHKEGHATAARTGLWVPPFDKRGPMRLFFNWWVGLYYGVMPASFAVGHSINHHRYNNGPSDVTSTSDKPRDSALAFLCYIPRMLLYVSNVSTVRQFCKERQYLVSFKVIYGSLYYLAFIVLVVHWYGLNFALAYVGYPFLENTLLLSCIGWVWHAFVEPDDVENEFVQSITILGGTINVLNEDSHVVHHQYPGSHWSRQPQLLTKHAPGYDSSIGSVFYGTHCFEIFALILLKDYDKLAERFVGRMPENAEGVLFHVGFHDKDSVPRPKCPLSHADAAALIRRRLRACWWGPRARNGLGDAVVDSAGESFKVAAEWEHAPGWGDEERDAAEDAGKGGLKALGRGRRASGGASGLKKAGLEAADASSDTSTSESADASPPASEARPRRARNATPISLEPRPGARRPAKSPRRAKAA